MNANELADELSWSEMDTDEIETWTKEAATMLRQQQARIEVLEVNVKFWVAMAEKERVRADRYEQ